MSERIKAFKEIVDLKEIPGPDRRVTSAIPRPLQVETLLKDVLKETIETRDAVHTLTNTVTAVAQDVSVLKAARVADEVERRRHSGSIAAVKTDTQKTSQHNLEQDAAIAHVITEVSEVKTAVVALAKETDIQTSLLRDLKSIKDNKTVQRIAYLIGAILLAILMNYAKQHGVPIPL
jgi:hypothetical protein